MRKIETYGHIKAGKLFIHYRDRFQLAVSQSEDMKVRVTVEKLYKKRSTYTFNEDTGKEGRGQNGYYFSVVLYEFCEGYRETTGEIFSKNQAHELLKGLFHFKEIVSKETGEIVKVPLSTSSMTTVEFEEYLDQCRHFIYEYFGVTVPLPNEKIELPLTIEEECK